MLRPAGLTAERQQPACRGQYGPSQRLAVRRAKSAESAVGKSAQHVDDVL